MTETNEQPNQSTNPPTNANNEPPDWYKNPPPWFSSAPQQATGNAGQSQNQPVQSRTDILNAVNGLPDQIVNAIREAFPAPQPTQNPTNDQGGASNAPNGGAVNANGGDNSHLVNRSDAHTPGKRGGFAEWWFGG